MINSRFQVFETVISQSEAQPSYTATKHNKKLRFLSSAVGGTLRNHPLQ